MKRRHLVTMIFPAVWSVVLVAQAPQLPKVPLEPAVRLQPGETPVAGECLTREELDLNARLMALKRPTRGVEFDDDRDDNVRFNPHYFVGTWTGEGTLPESALGPAGEFAATETVQHVEGCYYDSTMAVTAENGKYTVKTLTAYDRRSEYLVRLEQDSRGFQLLKIGRIGGDPGGNFTHYWEVPPVTHGGKRVRLKGTTFVASPEQYRVRMQISEDGGAFVNYGTLIWRRTAAK